MKKIIMSLFFMACIISSVMANQPEKTVMITTADDEEVSEIPVTITVLSESNGFVEFLVEANDVVNDVCNYFNGSWADVALDIYCTFGGDVYTCTAYKIAKLACALNGAVKLYLEGDINNATKKVLTTGAKIWVMSKVSGKIKLSPSNMCTAN